MTKFNDRTGSVRTKIIGTVHYIYIPHPTNEKNCNEEKLDKPH